MRFFNGFNMNKCEQINDYYKYGIGCIVGIITTFELTFLVVLTLFCFV
jgi:hypothetical protein